MDNALTEEPYLQTILIVDDEANNISILNEILQDDYRILFAFNGPDAINLCKNYKPDLILLDIIMPDMTGYEVCKSLKKDQLTTEVPIIFISALEKAEDKVRGFDAGGVDYITKPFEVPEVQARIKTHLTIYDLKRELVKQNQQLRTAQKELEYHHTRLLQERHFIEEILVNIRRVENIDTDNLSYLMESVETTTGDFLFSKKRADGVQNILVGDFTGHGLQSAVGGPVVYDLFTSRTAQGAGMADIMGEINVKLLEILPSGTFLAACGVELNSDNKECLLWNCGMPSILIFRGGKLLDTIKSHEMALGITKNNGIACNNKKLELQTGDRIFAYSDGIVEAISPENKMFGEERLISTLSEMIMQKQELDNLKDILNQFRESTICEDDITIVDISI
ncbi:MAG: fused response regulator/phosphatase [Magnetococcales bacterium]|nr:fused response regulator/phosphatase [Magnetococcales bacterium]